MRESLKEKFSYSPIAGEDIKDEKNKYSLWK